MRTISYVTLILAMVTLSGAAMAQDPAGAHALGPAAVADSQNALRTLADRIRTDPKDAAAWYRQGMISWALAARARAENPPRELDATRLGYAADTSLRIAAQLESSNPLYQLMAGRFLLSSGVAITRSASYGFFEAAVEAARLKQDRTLLSEAAVEYGRVFWRRYDAVAYRRDPTAPESDMASVSIVMMPPCTQAPPPNNCPPRPMKTVRELVVNGSRPVAMGEDFIGAAENLFNEAYDASPTNPRALRALATTKAERSDWKGLELLGKRHTAAMPWDGWGWLVLGLAKRRQRDDNGAAAAFDSAFVYLDANERARLDDIRRVTYTTDTSKLNRMSPAERASYSRFYWAMADPLWTRYGNPSRSEYLARVVFSELRWTVDEMNVHGADSDRGHVYIRYGPPEIMGTFHRQDGMSTVWVYGTDFAFVFVGQPTFATARTPAADNVLTDGMFRAQPVRWDNVVMPVIDSLDTQLARFRGGSDSLDVMVAANFPIDSIRASQAVRVPVRGEAFWMDGRAAIVRHDSSTLERSGLHQWTSRIGAGSYVLRVQASSDDASRAARATSIVELGGASMPLRGMAVSDLLIGTGSPSTNAMVRWRDAGVTPVVGAVPKGSTIALVWENYEFGAKDGNAQYGVVIKLERQRSIAGSAARLGANILNLARGARIERGDDKLTVSFDRTVGHKPVIADVMNLTLTDTPGGKYTLTLEITDKVSGRTVTRTRGLTIDN